MLLKIGAGFLAIILGTLTAGTVALLQGGVGTVHIEDQDLNLTIPVPMAAAQVAISLMPERELEQIRRDMGPYREIIEATLEALAEVPDAVLVEVVDHDETVVVRKEDGDLVVNVDGSERVRIRVPIDSVLRIVRQLTEEIEITKS